MKTHITWAIVPGCTATVNDIQQAITHFYNNHNMKPTAIKMSINDMSSFMCTTYGCGVMSLEANKQYANYMQTPFGPIILEVLTADEVNAFYAGGSPMSVIVVENTEIDREFEKHVLGNHEKL